MVPFSVGSVRGHQEGAELTGADQEDQPTKLGFNELLLGAVIVLMLACAGLITALYVLPSEHLDVPELLPGVRVARQGDFPVGASRVVSWGDQIILVIRNAEESYAAVQGTSPGDGCVLQWDLESLRIVSPCTYVVWDLRGNVVTGLTTTPLRHYPVFIRAGVVYVGRET